MPQNAHLEVVNAEAEPRQEPAREAPSAQTLRLGAEALVRGITWLPNIPLSHIFSQRCAVLRKNFRPLFATLDLPPPAAPIPNDFHWLYDNSRLFYTEVQNTTRALKAQSRLPHVRTQEHEVVPRILALAEGFLDAVSDDFSEREFTCFVEAFQRRTVLQLRELCALVSVLKLVLLERIAARGARAIHGPNHESTAVGVCVRSLRYIGQTTWKDIVEPLIVFDGVLRQDPAGCYARMDFESRDYYRTRLSNIADHSDSTELEVAREALALAQEARRRNYSHPRKALRESHVGYYLVDRGVTLLHQKVGFRRAFGQRIQALLRWHPDEYFILGTEVLTFAIVLTALFWNDVAYRSPGLFLLSMLVLLLPGSQSALQLMNQIITTLLPPEILPKLDFSEGIPNDCVTLVAVPSLLLSEKQVRSLIENLEVRFLGNHGPNIHFALLTDLPDSREPAREDSPLISLCADLIRELNQKYASQGVGSFFLLHRHRVYNPRERAWMGWERKRGKLQDLNKLLRGHYDSFPVKAGDLSVLPGVRFVITLDSDTELPRGAAHRMVGTLAHPLNQAVIDPETNIVIAGYGILQPRVGVSVQSTARSRLAAIYAGETGFDIYTKAVSDAYQDLYREGIFTGKGIYEVDTVYQVLDRRFPRNALLSHDLIEGAYARAGLVSDIEVIEDYPSHYSAYNRRKHRWLRGDWQIAGWLFPRVPEESGKRVQNPISLISRWKILDNLRRSLVDPATFLLFVLGWLALGRSPWKWTLATIFILLVPAVSVLVFNLARSLRGLNLIVAREALSDFLTAGVNLFFNLTFLAHQMLLSLDAVVRALVRRFVTQRRLLEWETAAEAELGAGGQSPVDAYLNWTPALAFSLALLVWVARPTALPAALPLLLLWASSKLVSKWLNQPSVAPQNQAPPKDVAFLRGVALHTWRYFAEFDSEEHNWLIPDNVQEQPPAVAARISPTNLGFLLNARQVACEFGYLTVAEFAERTLRTLATVSNLRKHHGHLLNWYDTHTLEPMAPLFISSVDSGNLLASLWTLQQGSFERLRQPVLQPCLAQGVLDYLRALVAVRALPRKRLSDFERQLKTGNWLHSILDLPEIVVGPVEPVTSKSKPSNSKWFAEEAGSRLCNIRQAVRDYTPWLLPEFMALRDDSSINLKVLDSIALEHLTEFQGRLIEQLDLALLREDSLPQKSLYGRLRDLLSRARTNTAHLVTDLRMIAAESGKLADAMDFASLLDRRRKLMSVGFDVETQHLHSACYDLLGTESRTAVFVAIAKEDIPQESWFLLGRSHTLAGGHPVLLSWTGTMFEYLMPALWMRSYSNTLLDRSRVAAVRAQQRYAVRKGVPWGISESAYLKLDEAGNYQYLAFGLPQLALHKTEVDALVISPYSTFLALSVDPGKALRNLHRMFDMGWSGEYGFYESADYSSAGRRFWQPRYQVVRCWMAHHQGMTLLALANFLKGNVVQKWFHSERRVQATELLLHEKPVSHVRRSDIPHQHAA